MSGDHRRHNTTNNLIFLLFRILIIVIDMGVLVVTVIVGRKRTILMGFSSPCS